MRIALVINQSAGTMRRLPAGHAVSELCQALESRGDTVELFACDRRDLAKTLSALALRADMDRVIVGGGDGTFLTAVLSGLGQTKPLGILPLGTLNLLSRDLGLPSDPFAAAAALSDSSPVRIDLAEVNGHPFAIWASLGLHPWIVRRRDKLQRTGMAKWIAFALAAFRALKRYPLIEVTLTVAGEKQTIVTPLMVISNNAWREETLPLRRAALDQGLLEVHVARVNSRLGLIRLAAHTLLGGWRQDTQLETHQASEVRVTSRKHRTMVSLDGEVAVMRSPLIFRSCPKALSLLMPKHQTEQR